MYLPHLSILQFTIPHLTTPHLSVHLSIPPFTIPQSTIPQSKIPHLTWHLTIPKSTISYLTIPQLTIPHLPFTQSTIYYHSPKPSRNLNFVSKNFFKFNFLGALQDVLHKRTEENAKSHSCPKKSHGRVATQYPCYPLLEPKTGINAILCNIISNNMEHFWNQINPLKFL